MTNLERVARAIRRAQLSTIYYREVTEEEADSEDMHWISWEKYIPEARAALKEMGWQE